MTSLADIAFTLQVGRTALPCRLAFVAASRDEVISKLDAFIASSAGKESVWFTRSTLDCDPRIDEGELAQATAGLRTGPRCSGLGTRRCNRLGRVACRPPAAARLVADLSIRADAVLVSGICRCAIGAVSVRASTMGRRRLGVVLRPVIVPPSQRLSRVQETTES